MCKQCLTVVEVEITVLYVALTNDYFNYWLRLFSMCMCMCFSSVLVFFIGTLFIHGFYSVRAPFQCN